jgi:Tfp pilus assembly protein PilF
MRRFVERYVPPLLAILACVLFTPYARPAQAPIAVPAVDPPLPSGQQQLKPTQEQIGDALMMHGRYQAAIEAYKKAPQESSVVWNKMGIAHQMMFNLTDATRSYQMSLKLDPKDPNVLNNLGTVLDAQKDYGAAEKMYRKALKLNPKSALVLKNLGTNLLAQHKYKKGWAVYQAALAVDPTVFDATSSPRVENPASLQERGAMNYYMAKGCVRAGMPDRAIEYLRMAINEGFTSTKKIIADNEFVALHGLPAFEQLIADQKTP